MPHIVTQARWPVKSGGHLLLPASATGILVNSPKSVSLSQVSICRASKKSRIKSQCLHKVKAAACLQINML